ncbi:MULTISPECIES: hypothetical protein [Amycolatopsis]|uniref:WXG100 family type VII secretion target n=2 Tax=Amycolatopsis TaxID=1813 RepID=A0A1I3WYH6_9PSEU|nr:hypothetical protein [Amycolatopsis sacchari]SFK12169.1 hypothetical protein SAMN05421835_11434 [Amycolatopsis sacchari]
MAEKFFLDPAALARETQALRGTGRRLSVAVEKLNAVLDRHDGCWGKDDIGEAFEKNYAASARETRGYNKDAADGIVQVSDDLDKDSELFQSVDEDNAERIDRSQQ